MTTALSVTADILSPGANIEDYIRSVSNIPILDKQSESDLIERFINHEDLEAAKVIIMSHLRFVVHIAKTYSGYGLPQADLIQEGNIGLMKALKRFDPKHGVRLISFAVHWIKSEIHEFILKNWKIVKIATTKDQRKLFFNLRSKKSSLQWLNKSEAENIAEDLKIPVKTVFEMEERLQSQDVSFDPLLTDDSESQDYKPKYFLQSEEATPEETIISEDWNDHTQACLKRALLTLDEKARCIVESRWLSTKKKTLTELAKQFNVSAERIRQIEAEAIKSLQSHF